MDRERVISYLQTISIFLEKIAKVFCFVAFLGMIVVVVIAILSRYVFHYPQNYAGQVAKYLLIYMSFVAAGLAEKDRMHISIDMFTRKMPTRIAKRIKITVSFFVSLFFLIIIYFGVVLMIRSSHFTDPIVWDLSFRYIYFSIPLGFSYMLIQFNINTVLFLLQHDQQSERVTNSPGPLS